MKNQALVTLALVLLHPFLFDRYGRKVLYIPMVPWGGTQSRLHPTFNYFICNFVNMNGV
jgi:hypothetical protein